MARRMRPPARAAVVVLAAAAAAAGLSAQTKEFRVGTFGAKVELEHPWRREKADQGHGFDGSEPGKLFGRAKEVHVVVRELRALVETESDARQLMTARGELGDGTGFEFAREATWTRSTRDLVSNDGSWAMRYEILAKDGLAYDLMFWADPRDADFLEERAEDFRRGFVFPGEGS